MADYKTPGVYIVEKNAFPSSAVAVATAVPVFLGYTEKAERKGNSLFNVPTKISSLAEYVELFGGAFQPLFDFKKAIDPKLSSALTAAQKELNDNKDPKRIAELTKKLSDANDAVEKVRTKNANYRLNDIDYSFKLATNYELYLYTCLRFFYLNGGSDCYIMSIGSYEKVRSGGVLKSHFSPTVFDILAKEWEPTMVLVPDALALADKNEYYTLCGEVLDHCNKTQSRFAIFDVKRASDPGSTNDSTIKEFRESNVGTNFLKYGAAYYPWLKTSVVEASELNFTNLSDLSVLLTEIPAEEEQAQAVLVNTGIKPNLLDQKTYDSMKAASSSSVAASLTAENTKRTTDAATALTAFPATIKRLTLDDYNKLKNDATQAASLAADLTTENNNRSQKITNLHQSLIASSPTYKKLMEEMRAKVNLLPPSAAMAGIYTLVDTARGVWKSPANVSVSAVNAPEVNISAHEQENMNVDPISGKSINIIRAFPGIGTLVWGGRTLDGNSQDWRYINVRRTLIMIEQSLKLATRAYVFEPNDSGTWVTIQSMMNNFLYNLWKQGALAGSVPEQAYSVQIGLGVTMTPTDILDGLLRITVLVAIVRPAEFIEITFQQQQQQS